MFTCGMPFCCTAQVFYSFEPGQDADGKQRRDERKIKRLRKEMITNLNRLKKDGYAVVFATTTNLQTNAEIVLKELGFYTSPNPITKTRHSYTEVSPWFMPLDEWEND